MHLDRLLPVFFATLLSLGGGCGEEADRSVDAAAEERPGPASTTTRADLRPTEERLIRIDEQVERIRAGVQERGEKALERLAPVLQEVDAGLQAVHRRLEGARAASGEALENARQELERSLDRLEETLARANDELERT